MKKLLSLLIASILTLTACDNKKEENISVTKPEVKIGVILPLTGNYAEIGNNVKAALEFAKDDLENESLKVKYVFEDYGYESSRAAVLAHKLINIDKVNAIISYSSPAGFAVAPITKRNNVMHISITNTKEVAEGKTNFTNFTSSEAYIDKFIEMVKNNNVKSVYMFVVYQPSMQQTANLLEKRLKTGGYKVERENFTMDAKSFDMMQAKALSKNFDVWYVAAMSPTADIFLNNYHNKGIKTPIVSVDSFNFIKDKKLIDGMEFISPAETNNDLLLSRIKDKTGSDNFFSLGFVYDSAAILIKSYEKLYHELARVPSSEEVAEDLLKTKKYNGVVGEITINEDGVVDSKAVIKKVVDGKPILVSK